MTVHPLNSELTQIDPAARDVLLNCLRAYTARQQLYCNDLKSVGVALTSCCISTDQAMQQLHEMDGLACLGTEQPRERDWAIEAMGEEFMREVMRGPKRTHRPRQRQTA